MSQAELEMLDPEGGSMQHNLFQSPDGNFRGSRDYAMDNVPCEVVCCPVNRNAHCAMPSVIKIKANGKCEQGEEALAKAYEAVKQKTKMPVDGD
jgi:hypothetical protein